MPHFSRYTILGAIKVPRQMPQKYSGPATEREWTHTQYSFKEAVNITASHFENWPKSDCLRQRSSYEKRPGFGTRQAWVGISWPVIMVTQLWIKTSKLKGSLSLLLQNSVRGPSDAHRAGEGAWQVQSDLKGLDCPSPFPAGQQRVKNMGLRSSPASTTGTHCVNLRQLASLSLSPFEIIIILLKYSWWESSPHRADLRVNSTYVHKMHMVSDSQVFADANIDLLWTQCCMNGLFWICKGPDSKHFGLWGFTWSLSQRFLCFLCLLRSQKRLFFWKKKTNHRLWGGFSPQAIVCSYSALSHHSYSVVTFKLWRA